MSSSSSSSTSSPSSSSSSASASFVAVVSSDSKASASGNPSFDTFFEWYAKKYGLNDKEAKHSLKASEESKLRGRVADYVASFKMDQDEADVRVNVIIGQWMDWRSALLASSAPARAPTEDLTDELGALSLEDYSPSPLSPSDFSFDAKIDVPVCIGTQHWRNTDIDRAVLQECPFLKLSAHKMHRAVQSYICDFLKNETFGTSEDALHRRDDALFHIVRTISKLKPERNKTSSSTDRKTRPDGQLYRSGSAPSVLFEEKKLDGNLAEARNDLTSKFFFLPHYENLPWIVGVAIAGDAVDFGFLRDGFQSKLVLDLSSLSDRLRCIQAAINVGRWALYVQTNNIIHPLPIPMNVAVEDPNGRRSLCISFRNVVKRYLQLDADSKARLTRFYADTKEVKHIEHGVVEDEKKTGALKVTLTPVGVQRMPSSLEELQRCIKCILTALAQLHSLDWGVIDLRWLNIITLAGCWYIIDCEFASPFGSKVPQIKVVDPDAKEVSAACDLYMVGRLLDECVGLKDKSGAPVLDDGGLKLRKLLLSEERHKISAEALLKHPWLARIHL